jgi:tetratricopeptide (TPR) repeat protein
MRAFTGASLALSATVALSSMAGCSGVGELEAMKSFKEANQAYQQADYKKASELYEKTIATDPDEPRLVASYFFLGNSYDQLYKPSKKGDAANDANLTNAVKYYEIAAQKLSPTDNPPRSLALKYLASTYGSDKLDDPVKEEPVLQKMIMSEPGDPENYFALGNLYEQAGVDDEAEKIYLLAEKAKPNDSAVYLQLAGFYQRQGQFDKAIEALQTRADKEPTNPEAYHMIAGTYWKETMNNGGLKDAVKADHVQKGLQAEDKALQLKPDYVDALTFKGLLLRQEALIEKDPAKQQQLLKEAEGLTNKANELQHAGAGAKKSE